MGEIFEMVSDTGYLSLNESGAEVHSASPSLKNGMYACSVSYRACKRGGLSVPPSVL